MRRRAITDILSADLTVILLFIVIIVFVVIVVIVVITVAG